MAEPIIVKLRLLFTAPQVREAVIATMQSLGKDREQAEAIANTVLDYLPRD